MNTKTQKEIRVLLADDHEIVRAGLRSLIEIEPDVRVIADVGSGRHAVELTRLKRPEVVVMDISMPDMNGIEATRRITGDPKSRVLCLSMHKEKRMIVAMLKAGASGYLVKSCAAQELNEAIHVVVSGKIYISPSLGIGDLDDYVREQRKPKQGAFAAVTDREREVLQLIAEGVNAKEIADRLDVSAKTVAAHRLNIMNKLNIRSIAGLTHYAIQEGLCNL